MRTRWLPTLLGVCLALPAWAQNPPDRPGGRGGYGPPPGPGGAFPMERMSDRLVRELDLDEQQQTQLDAIAADFRQRRDETSFSPGQMRDLWRQMREARESGDQARVEELRQQMQEQRNNSRHLMDEFFNQVQTILRPDQVDRLTQLRARMGGPPEDRDRGARLRGMIQTLPDQLELDETQRAQFDDLLAGFRSQGEARRQRWQELRPLMDELRQAERAGDEARAEEIRAQLDAARAEAGNPFDSFFTELEKILRDDQKAKLAELRASFGPPEARPAETEPLDVRTVIRATRRLDLDTAQRESVRNITQEAMRSLRDLGRRDREAQTDLARKVKDEIAALLTPEQKAQLERILQGERPRKGLSERPGHETGQGRRGRDWDVP